MHAVSTFLQDSVSMFAAQARECGVTMSIIPSDKGDSELPDPS